ncbi:MAG: metal-dependent transcriptional regulator [bacterium]|nr:metal-dependent transcriptional regulator [bacterium]
MANTLSSGLEDYIEAIYVAQINNMQLKGADLARQLGISRASVSEALGKLSDKGLVQYESYGFVTLTEEGTKQADIVYNKHNIIERFLVNVLDVSQQEASENACKIEHIISNELLTKIHAFTHFADNNKDFFNKFKETQQNDSSSIL